jgi:hypothetical protein
MKRWLAGALALCWSAMPGWAAAAQIGCFSDGGVVFLHAGSTYQFYADKGDPRVDCTPAAVKIGLELTEEEAQSLCAQKSSLCEEKKAQAKLIRDTYPDLLRQSDYVEKAPLEQAPQQVAAEAAKPGDNQTPSPTASSQVRLNSRDTIRSVQKGLQHLGYDIGVADGKIGKRTTAAIRKYEKDNGMRVTGKISKALLVSLQKKAGVQ